MIAQRIPSDDCWKLIAVYDITDKICILGLPTTFTPADGGRKDVIHHLFTMGFIYSSVNSCPREWGYWIQMWGSGLFASFQICLQSLVARSPFCVLIMTHVLWSHSVNWVVRDCQKKVGVGGKMWRGDCSEDYMCGWLTCATVVFFDFLLK